MKKMIALATAICLSFGIAVAQNVAPQNEVKTEKTHKCSHDGKDHKCSKDANEKDHKCKNGADHKCSKDAKK